ncbi:Hsp20/alpha crystallin family protein [Xylophilus sp. GW821-FHT01B05]
MFFTPVIRRAAYGPALRAVDRGFERFVNEAIVSPAAQLRARAATADQNDTHWTLQIDVPGLSREQLSVAIEGAVVRIESVQDAPRSFKAAYELPQEIDTATSSAKQENGVLTLTLGKKQPVSNVTQLPIA